MNYHISSNDLNNPLLKELLLQLTVYFKSVGVEFIVIGATARDIILVSVFKEEISRATGDLDIIIAVPDWNRFDEIERGICSLSDFLKEQPKQRFLYKNIYIVDIVPFGGIEKSDNKIYWQPEEAISMSVLGFSEIAKVALNVSIDNDFEIKVVPLQGFLSSN